MCVCSYAMAFKIGPKSTKNVGLGWYQCAGKLPPSRPIDGCIEQSTDVEKIVDRLVCGWVRMCAAVVLVVGTAPSPLFPLLLGLTYAAGQRFCPSPGMSGYGML